MTDSKKNSENQDRIPIYIEKPWIRVDVDTHIERLENLASIRGEYLKGFLKVGDISPDFTQHYSPDIVPEFSVSIIYHVKEDLTKSQIDSLVSAILEKVQTLLTNPGYKITAVDANSYDTSLIKRVVVHGSGEIAKRRVLEVLEEVVWYLTDVVGFQVFMDWQPSSLTNLLAEKKTREDYWLESMEIPGEIGDILDKLLQFIYRLLKEK